MLSFLKRCALGGATLAAASLALAAPADAAGPAAPAQDRDYPSRPITIIVTFPPGGGTDLLARKLGMRLQESLGQAVIVDNRPGASGNIGSRAVAYARADGYTLLMANSSFAINPGVYRNLGFDPKADFAPVANVGFVPSVLVTAEGSGIASLQDVLAVRSEPSLAYASCGNGTPQHLAGEMLYETSGTYLLHIPYRGCGPALNDVVAGQVPVGIVTLSSASALIASGRLRALAVTSPQRSPVLADVPTVAEIIGQPFELDQWHGLLAPSHTPAQVVRRLNEAVREAVALPALQRELMDLGYTPQSPGPQALAQGFRDIVWTDIDRFGLLARKIGLQVD